MTSKTFIKVIEKMENEGMLIPTLINLYETNPTFKDCISGILDDHLGVR